MRVPNPQLWSPESPRLYSARVVLRTMGATSGAVMRIFLMTGAAIGVTGTIAGVISTRLRDIKEELIEVLESWPVDLRGW